MQESTKTLVTLIHGTWASKTWRTQETSWPGLSKTLEDRLPKPVKLCHFTWDGKNRVKNRANAASKLQRHVKTLNLPPDVRHYIVAHSHGGTVAVMALRDRKVRERVHGLVCLSTPFLHASRRKMLSISNEMFGAALFTNLVLVTWLGKQLLAWSFLRGIGIGLLVVAVAIVIAATVHDYARGVSARMRLPNLGKFPILILRAPGDDTSLPLAAFRCVGWLASSHRHSSPAPGYGWPPSSKR
jgi:hypothetical protein